MTAKTATQARKAEKQNRNRRNKDSIQEEDGSKEGGQPDWAVLLLD